MKAFLLFLLQMIAASIAWRIIMVIFPDSSVWWTLAQMAGIVLLLTLVDVLIQAYTKKRA